MHAREKRAERFVLPHACLLSRGDKVTVKKPTRTHFPPQMHRDPGKHGTGTASVQPDVHVTADGRPRTCTTHRGALQRGRAAIDSQSQYRLSGTGVSYCWYWSASRPKLQYQPCGITEGVTRASKVGLQACPATRHGDADAIAFQGRATGAQLPIWSPAGVPGRVGASVPKKQGLRFCCTCHGFTLLLPKHDR